MREDQDRPDRDNPTPPSSYPGDPVFIGYSQSDEHGVPAGTAIYEQQGQLIYGGSGNWQPWFGDRGALQPTVPRAGTPPPSPTPSPTPNPGGSPPPTNAPTSYGTGYFTGEAPSFSAPSYTPPPPFKYADFIAPTPEDLTNDPVYQYTLKNEQDAIQKSAAARGVLNTGGTINDLLLNAKDIAATGYHDLWNRKANEYMLGRQNALDTYNTNYSTQFKDPYSISYQGATDTYNSAIHNYDLGQQYGWYGKLFDFEKDKDAFDRRYRLLSFA